MAPEVSDLADQVVLADQEDRNKNWLRSLTKTKMVGSTKKSERKLALRPKPGVEAADRAAVAQVVAVDRVALVALVDHDRLQNLVSKFR